MSRKLFEAMTEAVDHRRAFDEFNQHLRTDNLEQVQLWEKEYEEWDKVPAGSPCIFDTKDPGTSFFLPDCCAY